MAANETFQKKKVYIAMAGDLLHHGHINVINEARKYGDIIIGLLTDEAIASYKRIPPLNFEQRKIVLENIKGVKEVVPQTTIDYTENLQKYKPDYVVHGDDWRIGVHRELRKQVIETLKKWQGQLIEVPYTKDVSSNKLLTDMSKIGTTPELRMKKLRKLLPLKLVRVLEAHNGLTGLIVENTNIIKNGIKHEFDGIWVGSLTDSLSKGKPDTGFIDLTSKINTLHQILEVTTKPIIIDGDDGGSIEHFPHIVKTLERLGISAIIIEDKTGFKRNSLLEKSEQEQDTIENFCRKIKVGKQSQITDDFMIIARIESLILGKGLADALERAKAYIEAGANGIMIHSKKKEPDEILDFCEEYSKLKNRVPLVAIPTTYNSVTEEELKNAGVNMVIYANHLLRSAYQSMKRTAEMILSCGRCCETEEYIVPLNDILNLLENR